MARTAFRAALLLITGWLVAGDTAPGGTPLLLSREVCRGDGPFPSAHGSTIVELPGGALLCAWYAGSSERGDDTVVAGSELPPGAESWSPPRVLAGAPGKPEGSPVLHLSGDGVLWLFHRTAEGNGDEGTRPGPGWTTSRVKAITSRDGGRTWSAERTLAAEPGHVTRSGLEVLRDGTWLLPLHDARDWSSRVLRSPDRGRTWELSARIDSGLGRGRGNIEPALLERTGGGVLCYLRGGGRRYRTWRSLSADGGRHWSPPLEIGVPNPGAPLDLLRLASGRVIMALNPVPGEQPQRLSIWISTDDAETWTVFREVPGEGYASHPALIQSRDGLVHLTYSRPRGGIGHMTFNEAWVWEPALVKAEYRLPNVLPPLLDPDDPRTLHRRTPGSLPVVVKPFGAHLGRRVEGPPGEIRKLAFGAGGVLLAATSEGTFARDEGGRWSRRAPLVDRQAADLGGPEVRGAAESGGWRWMATEEGLYRQRLGPPSGPIERHPDYGLEGPLATRITAVAADSRGRLWVGTPLGLSVRDPAGSWRSIRGRDGLPWEEVTSLAIDGHDRLWIGTTRGAVHYRPDGEGRRWFYRAGRRYLPGDRVAGVAVTPDGRTAYFATDGGLGRIDTVTTTLLEKARAIERRIAERHRRLGLVASCVLDDPEHPSSYRIPDNDNDGLWTAYHVAAMSLCHAVTGEEEARRSARESMHALFMLQNASGTPGLVARSVLPLAEGRDRGPQWRLTPDGKRYWKSDTSSDEIDGHYLAFYTYWEHVARFEPEERKLVERQVRAVTDYLLAGGYLLIDWDGERTTWGFWSPELLNGDPRHYLENGLNSLQMLSFLKIAHHITGDPRYKRHYDGLIGEHGYLGNVLLEKKVFPDEENHSDSQLAFVAWYPLLQLERDPRVRRALHGAVWRHWRIVARERSSFFDFVAATIDPDIVDIEGAIRTLKEMPEDRRRWRMENSHRADVVFDPRRERFGRRQLLESLPVDERDFAKWNGNPFLPDGGGDGREEDDGAAYLLPYWMGRYHGFLAEAE